MALDEVERAFRVEPRQQDHRRAKHLVQRREECNAAVVSGSAHQVNVGLAELEDRDDLQDVRDVNAMRPPRALGFPVVLTCRSIRRTKRFADRWEVFSSLGHQVGVTQPAGRHSGGSGDEGHAACTPSRASAMKPV